MEEKIEQARREFNPILDYTLAEALGLQIHKVEDGIYRRLLRLGQILLLFQVASDSEGSHPV